MIETFMISDTHFQHANIIKFDETKMHRPFDTIEEHDEELIRRWNAVVKPKDNVWHLGDFCFGGVKNIAIAERLNGAKRLVLGNHDHYGAAEYLKYFTKVMGVAEYKGLLLSHIPVHPTQLTRWKANVHGHLHTHCINDPHYINISAEQVNLTPVPFDYILDKLKEIQ